MKKKKYEIEFGSYYKSYSWSYAEDPQKYLIQPKRGNFDYSYYTNIYWVKFEIACYWCLSDRGIEICCKLISGEELIYKNIWKKIKTHILKIQKHQKYLLESLSEHNDISSEYLREYLVCDFI